LTAQKKAVFDKDSHWKIPAWVGGEHGLDIQGVSIFVLIDLPFANTG
jgi:hypothetical protein